MLGGNLGSLLYGDVSVMPYSVGESSKNRTCGANDRRFYTYDCCCVSVRRLLSVYTILVKHKTKMSTLIEFSNNFG